MKAILFFSLTLAAMISHAQPGDEIMSRARSQMDAGDYRKAISILDSLISKDSSVAAAYNMRACATIYSDVLNDEKNNKTAIRYFMKAIQLDSLDYRYYSNRGWAWQFLNKNELSLRDYRKALSLDSTNVELHANVLRNLYFRNRNREALAYSDRIIIKFPEDGYAYYVRGQLKRDYLHQYPEGNIDVKKGEELGWREGVFLYY